MDFHRWLPMYVSAFKDIQEKNKLIAPTNATFQIQESNWIKKKEPKTLSLPTNQLTYPLPASFKHMNYTIYVTAGWL